MLGWVQHLRDFEMHHLLVYQFVQTSVSFIFNRFTNLYRPNLHYKKGENTAFRGCISVLPEIPSFDRFLKVWRLALFCCRHYAASEACPKSVLWGAFLYKLNNAFIMNIILFLLNSDRNSLDECWIKSFEQFHPKIKKWSVIPSVHALKICKFFVYCIFKLYITL